MGVWLDLASRKAIAPPAQLAAAMDAADKTEDWQAL